MQAPVLPRLRNFWAGSSHCARWRPENRRPRSWMRPSSNSACRWSKTAPSGLTSSVFGNSSGSWRPKTPPTTAACAPSCSISISSSRPQNEHAVKLQPLGRMDGHQLDCIPGRLEIELMTVHAAKGLEFDCVFVLRLTRGDFPTWPRRPEFEFPAELLREGQPQGDFHIQEERRLFYVALTRARDLLTLTAVVNRRQKPSPFLDDILRAGGRVKTVVERLQPTVPREAPPVGVGTLETPGADRLLWQPAAED